MNNEQDVNYLICIFICMNPFLQDPAITFNEAATRLYMKIEYEAHDFFTIHIYYHISSYIKFTFKKSSKQ